MNEQLVDTAKLPPTKTFEDATPLLADPEALRAKADQDGFLYFKGLTPKDVILSLRRQTMEILDKHGYLDKSRDIMDGAANMERVHELSEEEVNWNGVGVPQRVYHEIQKLQDFHAFAHEPKLIQMYETLMNKHILPHPRHIGRFMLPHDNLQVTPSHQDFLHIQGAEATWTCWAPLGDVPQTLGGLAILEGSHKAGLLGVSEAPGAGGLESILCGMDYKWVGGDYELGDFVTFNSLTVHKALPNQQKGRIRLSMDIRYQTADDLIVDGSILPHGPFEWDELYEGWTNEDLKYYWKKHELSLVQFDPSIRWQREKIC